MSIPFAADQSGSIASTSSAVSSSTPTQPGPLSIHSRSTTWDGSIRRARTMRSRSSSETSPERMNGGPAKARRPLPRPAQPDQPGPALLHQLALGLRHSPGLQPGVRGADGRVPGERQLEARREDPQPVVRLVGGGLRAGTSSRRGSSSWRTWPCPRPDPVGVVHDGDRVAEEGLAGEDVDLAEAAHGGHYTMPGRPHVGQQGQRADVQLRLAVGGRPGGGPG